MIVTVQFVSTERIGWQNKVVTQGREPAISVGAGHGACKVIELQKRLDKRTQAVIEENPKSIDLWNAGIFTCMPLKPMVIEPWTGGCIRTATVTFRTGRGRVFGAGVVRFEPFEYLVPLEWSEKSHHKFPKQFRDEVFVMLCMWMREEEEQEDLDDIDEDGVDKTVFNWPGLPSEVLLLIIQYLGSEYNVNTVISEEQGGEYK